MMLYQRPERYVHLVTARLPKRVTQVPSQSWQPERLIPPRHDLQMGVLWGTRSIRCYVTAR